MRSRKIHNSNNEGIHWATNGKIVQKLMCVQGVSRLPHRLKSTFFDFFFTSRPKVHTLGIPTFFWQISTLLRFQSSFV